ncbi:MAG: hypothetical protein K9M82_06010, partial [Deltaproteobacteria bacterium]|nr:hypothetical protein [Deltaproteobacteria bacterium]
MDVTRFALVADPEFSWMHDLFPPFRLAEARGVPVDRAVLVNLLNHVHFSGRSILVHLPDPAYPQGRFESARPEPCSGDELVCRRLGGYGTGPGPRPSDRIHLLIDQGRSAILVSATVRCVEGDGFSLRLPACGYAVGERGNRRYSCRGVVAHVMDGDLLVRGVLLDFSPHGFRVGIDEPVEGFGDPRGGRPVLRLCLRREKEVVFSGPCACAGRRGLQWNRELILVPEEQDPAGAEESRIRNPRQRLVPSPSVLFEHPLLEKTVQMEVSDLSTAGMCVHETPGRAKLVRGLIIPELFIDFGTRHRLKAAAEVVYRREEDGAVRCGMAIRDMSLEHYSRLAHILTHALDPHTYISCDVDMEGLWSFFFRSGFIYPEKYRRIHGRRRSLEGTYRRLYQE